MYCSVSDVLREAHLTVTDISNSDCTEFIKDAESEIDRVTNSTFWNLEKSGTATAGGTNTITDSTASFGTNSEYVGDYLWIYSGTGSGQLGKIASHTATILTMEDNWATQPDNTSKYRLVHCGKDPRLTEYYSGDGSNFMFTQKYPIVYLVSVTIDSSSITLTDIYQDTATGRLELKRSAAQGYWSYQNPQSNVIVYWFGVYLVPRIIKKATALFAAINALNNKMGANADTIGSVTLPEGSYSIGSPTKNIQDVINALQKQYDEILKTIPTYLAMG